jgi:CBS domain-containing protein
MINRQSLLRELGSLVVSVVISVLFLALGFLAVLLSKELLKLESEVSLVFLLLAPIIIYLIFSGRLTEFRAGGLEAKFVSIANMSVELSSETIEPSVNEMEIVAKGGARELQRQLQRLDESKPIILTLTLGKEGYYNQEVWLRYMEALSQYRNFKFVVVLDQENDFLAYIPAWAMLQILKMGALGYEFVWIINEGKIRELRQYPGVVTKTISTKSTNLEALREMTDQNLEALVVIDEKRKLKGIVEREQVLSKLLLGMGR